MPVSSSRRVRTDSLNPTSGLAKSTKKGRKVPIQEQPFRVPAILAERPGRSSHREQLQARLWLADTHVDPLKP